MVARRETLTASVVGAVREALDIRGMSKHRTLTAKRLRELCAYDPATGAFTWRRSKGAAPAGSPVGGKHRSKGYGDAVVDGERHATHRMIWLYAHGRWPKGEIDHINGDRSDNRLANLRDVSGAVNRQNQRAATSKNLKSKLIGAHWNKRYRVWRSHIHAGGKPIYLGQFASAEEAHAAYVTAKRKLHKGCTI